jgi:hypothetical protein
LNGEILFVVDSFRVFHQSDEDSQGIKFCAGSFKRWQLLRFRRLSRRCDIF